MMILGRRDSEGDLEFGSVFPTEITILKLSLRSLPWTARHTATYIASSRPTRHGGPPIPHSENAHSPTQLRVDHLQIPTSLSSFICRCLSLTSSSPLLSAWWEYCSCFPYDVSIPLHLSSVSTKRDEGNRTDFGATGGLSLGASTPLAGSAQVMHTRSRLHLRRTHRPSSSLHRPQALLSRVAVVYTDTTEYFPNVLLCWHNGGRDRDKGDVSATNGCDELFSQKPALHAKQRAVRLHRRAIRQLNALQGTLRSYGERKPGTHVQRIHSLNPLSSLIRSEDHHSQIVSSLALRKLSRETLFAVTLLMRVASRC